MNSELSRETVACRLSSPRPRGEAVRSAAHGSTGPGPSGADTACDRIRRRLTELRQAFDEEVRWTPPIDQKPGESFLLLSVAGEAYAYPLRRLMEVTPPLAIVPVPNVPEKILGIMNYRGEIRTVIDLRRVLGIPGDPDQTNCRILVTRDLPVQTALLVDEVNGIAEWAQDQLAPVPATVPDGRARFLTGRILNKGRPVFVLDPKRLVTEER
ncbi:MAG: purine-binding chemotaxis protein CheW [Planctomycetes bacterium]|nr:purine-binding chemotaxis protein CheW [Planctomycetota bacterium]